jgi:hypothetical protein
MGLLEETQHPLIPLDWNCILNVSTATTGLRPDYVILRKKYYVIFFPAIKIVENSFMFSKKKDIGL